ncbi:MAG: GNAT family N-acetyltransferase [Roseburia sp.]
MNTLVIEPMTTDADMEGKGFVHYTSWQETYAGLVDAAYLNEMSIEKCFENAGEIFALYVLKDYQHQKIGLALMNAAFEHLKDFRTIVLWVLKGNEHAIHFYETYGFSFDGASEEIILGTTNTELRMLFEK